MVPKRKTDADLYLCRICKFTFLIMILFQVFLELLYFDMFELSLSTDYMYVHDYNHGHT